MAELVFSEFKEGGCVGKPKSYQYFITCNEGETEFLCHWSGDKFGSLEEAKESARENYATECQPVTTQEAQDADLDERMKAAGMIPLSELLEGHGSMEKWMRHADVHTFDDFCLWVKMKQREFMTMRMKYELGDRDKDDDLFEWVFAHAAVFDDIATQLRALAAPDKETVQ